MKFVISILLLWVNFNSFCQDYIVTNEGDTLEGEIKEPMFEYLFFQRVVFRDGDRTVYRAEDLKGYGFGDDIYEVHDVGRKRSYLVFLKPIVRGYCTLYEYQYAGTTYREGVATTYSPSTTYYLKKPDEKVHEFKFSLLKTGRDLYFLDNNRLTFALRQGMYKKRDVKEIVERYNRERSK